MRIPFCACCLAVLGCHPAAAPAPTTPAVTNAAPRAPVTVEEAQRACVTAVLADRGEDPELAPEPPVAHAVTLEHDRIVCAVELRDAEHARDHNGVPVREVEVTLATLAPDDGGWRVTDRAVSRLEEGRDEQGGLDVEIKLEALAIRDDETAVLATMIQREDGPEHGREDSGATLYRVIDDRLVAVYEAGWTATTGEADNIERRTLTLADTSIAGFRDLELDVYHLDVAWATGGHCAVEYTIGERWTWQDGSYELAEAEEPPEAPACEEPEYDDDDSGDGDGDD